jgi:hypothetical protein
VDALIDSMHLSFRLTGEDFNIWCTSVIISEP